MNGCLAQLSSKVVWKKGADFLLRYIHPPSTRTYSSSSRPARHIALPVSPTLADAGLLARGSVRSDQRGGKGVLLFVGAVRTSARLAQLPTTRPPHLPHRRACRQNGLIIQVAIVGTFAALIANKWLGWFGRQLPKGCARRADQSPFAIGGDCRQGPPSASPPPFPHALSGYPAQNPAFQVSYRRNDVRRHGSARDPVDEPVIAVPPGFRSHTSGRCDSGLVQSAADGTKPARSARARSRARLSSRSVSGENRTASTRVEAIITTAPTMSSPSA